MGERQLNAGRGFGVGLVIGRLPVERAIAGFQHEAGGDGGAVEAQRQRVEPAGAVEGGERLAGESEPRGIVGERGAARALPALALDFEERLDPVGPGFASSPPRVERRRACRAHFVRRFGSSRASKAAAPSSRSAARVVLPARLSGRPAVCNAAAKSPPRSTNGQTMPVSRVRARSSSGECGERGGRGVAVEGDGGQGGVGAHPDAGEADARQDQRGKADEPALGPDEHEGEAPRPLVGQQRQQEAGLGEGVRLGAGAELGPFGRKRRQRVESREFGARFVHNGFAPETMASNSAASRRR